MNDPAKPQDKVNVPLPTLPNIPSTGGTTGSVKPAETDPLLAAARAYKAHQVGLPKIPVADASAPESNVTRK